MKKLTTPPSAAVSTIALLLCLPLGATAATTPAKTSSSAGDKPGISSAKWRLDEDAVKPDSALRNLTTVYLAVSQLGDVKMGSDKELLAAFGTWLFTTNLRIISQEEAVEQLKRENVSIPCLHLAMRTTRAGSLVSYLTVIRLMEFAARQEEPSRIQWINTFISHVSGTGDERSMGEDLWVAARRNTDVFREAIAAARGMPPTAEGQHRLPRDQWPEVLPDADCTKRSLRGLYADLRPIKEVAVACYLDFPADDPTAVDPKRFGLSAEALKTMLEQRLTKLGLTTRSVEKAMEQFKKDRVYRPSLHLDVEIGSNGEGVYFYLVNLALEETWINARDRGYPHLSFGWQVFNHGAANAGIKEAVIRAVDDSMKYFEWQYAKDLKPGGPLVENDVNLSGGVLRESLKWGSKVGEFKKLFKARQVGGIGMRWSKWTTQQEAFNGVPAKATYCFNIDQQLYGVEFECAATEREKLEAILLAQLGTPKPREDGWQSEQVRLRRSNLTELVIYNLDFAPDFLKEL